MYVIRNTDTGKYVARPGSRHSYVKNLEAAQTYPTQDAAEANRCPENEVVISVFNGVLRFP